MYAGLEDLDENVCSAESIYASALMGGEGFLDGIKKGAQSVVTWVKNIARKVVEWVRTSFAKMRNKNFIVSEERKPGFLRMLKEIESNLGQITQSQTEELGLNLEPVFRAMDKLTQAVNQDKEASFYSTDLRGEMIKISSKLGSMADQLKEEEVEKARTIEHALSSVGRSMAMVRKAIAANTKEITE